MSKKYFGTDGIRGKVGEELINPAFVTKLGWAAGKVLASQGANKVLIGKDTRISGYMLESALEAGLSAAGISVGLLGPMPTPAVAYLTKTFRAEAGIVISASHNPYYDNGIKFFDANGHKLSLETELAIEALMEEPMICVESHKLGKAYRVNDAAGRYIEYCKGTFPSDLSLKGLKIVVDCAHGATYHIAPDVLNELGAETILIGASPNGLNINDNVGATSMAACSEAVKLHRADLGFALDGDGDRIMMTDNHGNIIDGDQILFINARDALKSGRLNGGGVVGTLMTNLAMEKALNSLGVPFKRSDVGDKYVMQTLKDNGWAIGGEGSGHILNLNLSSTGDGMIAGLQVITAMLRANTDMEGIAKGFTKYPQNLVNVKVNGCADDILAHKETQVALGDAQRDLGDTGRALLRKSGTEPLIRVMVESQCPIKSETWANHIADTIKSI